MIETRGASRIRPLGFRSLFLARGHPPEGWEVLAMATQRKRHGGGGHAPGVPDVHREHRLEALEARMEHLERELEGLQDAVYRQAMLEDENIGELRRRMEPEQMARDLDRDARQRGL
jgi:hypothetical protein